MAILDDLTAAVADVRAKVDLFGPAVDAMESRITEILASSGMSDEDKAKVADAIAELQRVSGSAQAAVDDAADGVDEAVSPPA